MSRKELEAPRVSRSPSLFLLLVIAFSAPFLVLGAVAGQLPGLPLNLPASALMFISPALAALVLVYRKQGALGVWALAKRVAGVDRIRGVVWVVVAALLMPGVLLLSYAVMRALDRPLPDPRITVTVLSVVAFFVAAGCEEIGWTGYALDPLQRRWGTLPAALALGAFGALWHIVPYLQGDRSGTWIAGQCVFTVASRVVIVWLYNSSGGSLLVAIVFHAMSNVGSGAFPNSGSHYDPVVTGLIVAAVALAIILLTDRQSHDGPGAVEPPGSVLRGAGTGSCPPCATARPSTAPDTSTGDPAGGPRSAPPR